MLKLLQNTGLNMGNMHISKRNAQKTSSIIINHSQKDTK